MPRIGLGLRNLGNTSLTSVMFRTHFSLRVSKKDAAKAADTGKVSPLRCRGVGRCSFFVETFYMRAREGTYGKRQHHPTPLHQEGTVPDRERRLREQLLTCNRLTAETLSGGCTRFAREGADRR
jgi:hypothetical protein